MTHWAHNIAALNAARGDTSYSELARRSGLSASTVRWLLNSHNDDIRLSQLFPLWKALGYTVAVFVEPGTAGDEAYVFNDKGGE